ncbi:MAG: DUF2461 domain-containing protein [Bacteroidetes bacterium]|nr:DUF2461 domain-containing protein [Bacteroidota bacterium]HET6242912.1 DUF2461 domain-containing protein [Bacteroidia bacterium]
MSYFNPSFLNFFKELSKNNTTDWFNENRKTYEKEVKKPFSDFVQLMINRIQEYEPDVQIKPAEAIMRINKDIRFSKDKIPYNASVSANISRFGKKDKSFPGFYFQLSPEKIMIYGGAYAIEKETLQQIRNHIGDNLKEFSAVYNDKLFKENYGKIQGEQNKRIPPEFQSILEKEPLIANKQFYFSASLKPQLILDNSLPEVLMKYYVAGIKCNTFLRKAFN